MPSFVSRLLKSPFDSKRLVSQLTRASEGKVSALLRQLGMERVLGGFLGKLGGKRAVSTTPVLKDKELTDDLELATGIFKRELLLRQAGCHDPWAMKRPQKRGAGEENDPTEVPSAFNGRMVGCICLGDRAPKWMWVESGPPKRCECGHYFAIKSMPPV